MERKARISWAITAASAFSTNIALARSSVDQQLSLRTFSAYLESPKNDKDLYPSDSDVNQQVIFRDSIKIKATNAIRFEFNFYNLLIGASSKDSLVQTLLNSVDESNRTAALERHWHNSTNADAYLTIDRLNMSLKLGHADLTIGRFPINLSTMFVFVPNDFFAPFRAFDYYREFKPGVDGFRLDYGIGKRGQISLLGVAGFQTNGITSRTSSENRPSRNYSPEKASALVRGVYTIKRIEIGLLGGKVGPSLLGGLTMQGELGSIGIRAEGNQRSNQLTKQNIFVGGVGADYRLTGKISFQAEQYFNGGGFQQASQLTEQENAVSTPTLLLGRNYTGIVAVYDINGLLNLKTLLILNDSDRSLLGNMYLTYSVASNAQLVVALMSPRGRTPDGGIPQTEFGLYPSVLSVQTAIYF